jgi:CRISPR-associated protein Csm4
MAMKLIRFRLTVKGSWRTPWQADTFTGALAAGAARVNGFRWLEQELLAPWREGEPPFVLSDACPGDLLPAPALLLLLPSWPDERRKQVKKTAWLTREQFVAVQTGQPPCLPETAGPEAGFASEDIVFKSEVRLRNTLSRRTDTTASPGSLYPVDAMALQKGFSGLSLYARVAPGKESLLESLLNCLGEIGFGADASAGFGHFTLAGTWDDASWLDEVEGANGWISLSTFQPAAADPTAGYWQSFVKYGKLGPDFGIENVFKRPQWMLRPGACLRENGQPGDWYGRVITIGEMLAEDAVNELALRDIQPVHPAFALAVPMKWIKEYEV